MVMNIKVFGNLFCNPQNVGWMQEGRKCILMIFQEERFSVLQQGVHRK